MAEDALTVSDLGERKLIERFLTRLPRPPEGAIWSGDDAAVVSFASDALILTTDVMVEGIDFDLSYSGGTDVGWKIVAVNASDVAAMGGVPRYAVATLSLSADTAVGTVDDILAGMLEAAERWRIALVGGDVSGAAEVSVGMTLAGEVTAAGVVRRSGARPGDAICVTGALGGSAAGHEALRRGLGRRPDLAGLVLRHLRPIARVAEGHLLAELGATAMIDVSDGLAVDLANLLDASDVGCDMSLDAVPIDAALTLHAAELGLDPTSVAMLGGEDFELLFTIAEPDIERMRDALSDVEATIIGAVTASGRTVSGVPLENWRDEGWQHLQRR